MKRGRRWMWIVNEALWILMSQWGINAAGQRLLKPWKQTIQEALSGSPPLWAVSCLSDPSPKKKEKKATGVFPNPVTIFVECWGVKYFNLTSILKSAILRNPSNSRLKHIYINIYIKKEAVFVFYGLWRWHVKCACATCDPPETKAVGLCSGNLALRELSVHLPQTIGSVRPLKIEDSYWRSLELGLGL